MKKITIYLLASVLLSIVSLAHGRASEQLKDPDVITPPPGISLEKLDKIVDGALARRGWIKKNLISEIPHIVEVEYSIRAHRIVMKLEYDATKLQLSYADSDNLNYEQKKGKRFIHPKYMEWTQQLADQINANLLSGDEGSVGTSATAGTTSSIITQKMSASTPKEIFANFSKFKLEKTTINPKFESTAGNLATAKNLDHNLGLILTSKLDGWANDKTPSRTLIIKPHIEAVRFIGSGARWFAGRMAGRSWIYVKLNVIEENTNDTVAIAELYRVADAVNGFTLARADYKMVEDMASDITAYMENNYKTAIGGGTPPPAKIRAEVQ